MYTHNAPLIFDVDHLIQHQKANEGGAFRGAQRSSFNP